MSHPSSVGFLYFFVVSLVACSHTSFKEIKQIVITMIIMEEWLLAVLPRFHRLRILFSGGNSQPLHVYLTVIRNNESYEINNPIRNQETEMNQNIPSPPSLSLSLSLPLFLSLTYFFVFLLGLFMATYQSELCTKLWLFWSLTSGHYSGVIYLMNGHFLFTYVYLYEDNGHVLIHFLFYWCCSFVVCYELNFDQLYQLELWFSGR